jgi:hypothetical protein
LLSIRDGEPVEADTRAAIEASPEAAREVERLRALKGSLRALPEVAPPPGAWERILAEDQRAAAASRRVSRAVAGFAAAATVALVAVIVVVAGPSDDPPIIVRASWPQAQPVTYDALVAESVRLERVLAAIPPQPVARLGTASTIVGLEDQIALVDEQLAYGDAIGLERAQRAALWSERVDLMSALVLVRASQAQSIVFQTAGDTL